MTQCYFGTEFGDKGPLGGSISDRQYLLYNSGNLLGGSNTSKKWMASVWVFPTLENSEIANYHSPVFQNGNVNGIGSDVEGVSFVFAKEIGLFKFKPQLLVNEGNIERGKWVSPDSGDAWGDGVWSHWLIGVDFSTPGQESIKVYKNDVQKLGFTFTSSAVNKINTDHANFLVACLSRSGSPDVNFTFNGGIAALWISLNECFDFDVVANRRKFIGANGLSVDLGLDGSNPGVTPHVWMYHADPLGFQVNQGSTKDFGPFVLNPLSNPLVSTATHPGGCSHTGVVRHTLLGFSALHEPKGIDVAAVDSLYIADGKGAGFWDVHPKASSVPNGGGAGIPAAVTLTAPTSYTSTTIAVSGNDVPQGFTLATGPKATYTGSVKRDVEAHYSITLQHTDASSREVSVTWSKNGVVLEQYTQIVTLAQNIRAQLASTVLLELAINDFLEVKVKVAAGDIIVDNCYIACRSLPALRK